MHKKTSEFMKRLRERQADLEKHTTERLDAIQKREPNRPPEIHPSRDEDSKPEIWLEEETRPEGSIGLEKSSILGLVRGDVKAKSSTDRSKKQKK